MIISVIASVLIVIGIALIMGLSAEQVANDILKTIRPNDSLTQKAKNLRSGKKKHGIYNKIMSIKTALEATGKSKKFTVLCCATLVSFGIGVVVAILINNLFMLPVLSIAFALVPFLYVNSTLSYFENKTKEELETTLSIITTSYIRSDDIIAAVRENIQYIKPPLKEIFMGFEGEATSVSSNIKHALYSLKEKVDNEIFREWCDTLIQCQDDRTMKDTLLSVVQKLTDVRIVNSELKTMLAEARNEYLVMVALVVGNVPLLYLLNKDWFRTLIYTTPGKLVCGICGLVILITALFMMKFTKPIEYKR